MKVTRKQMVVAVAKDVLKLTRVLRVKPGTYLWIVGDAAIPQDPKELQKAIPEIAKHCMVCAKTAMVLAHRHLYGGAGMPHNNDISDESRELFGARRADLIEDVFEFPEAYGARFVSLEPKPRLRAIMRNIIRNGGTFKPRKRAV
jgi:hypothetical protein